MQAQRAEASGLLLWGLELTRVIKEGERHISGSFDAGHVDLCHKPPKGNGAAIGIAFGRTMRDRMILRFVFCHFAKRQSRRAGNQYRESAVKFGMISASVAALAMSIAGAVVAEESASKARLTVFSMQARVEVSAEGKVVAVQPDPELPDAVREVLESTVAHWRFAAPLKDGQPVGGVTYIRMGACATPVGDGYRLAFDYRSNGPRRDGPASPRFPVAQALARQSAKLNLIFRVNPDGAAVIEQIVVGEGRHAARAFRKALEEWIGNSRFEPEQLAGQPVATRVNIPVEFFASTFFRSREAEERDMQLEKQTWAAASNSCKALLGDAAQRDRTVILDSPFKLLSSG